MADRSGQSFSLHSAMCVSRARFSHSSTAALAVKTDPHKHTIHMACTTELLFPIIQNKDGIVLFSC